MTKGRQNGKCLFSPTRKRGLLPQDGWRVVTFDYRGGSLRSKKVGPPHVLETNKGQLGSDLSLTGNNLSTATVLLGPTTGVGSTYRPEVSRTRRVTT